MTTELQLLWIQTFPKNFHNPVIYCVDYLLEEGFVREIISKVQTMRKEAGFEVMDKIAVTYEGTEKAEKVFADNASTIADETLALEVTKAAPAGYTKEWKINGEAVTIGVEKR